MHLVLSDTAEGATAHVNRGAMWVGHCGLTFLSDISQPQVCQGPSGWVWDSLTLHEEWASSQIRRGGGRWVQLFGVPGTSHVTLNQTLCPLVLQFSVSKPGQTMILYFPVVPLGDIRNCSMSHVRWER